MIFFLKLTLPYFLIELNIFFNYFLENQIKVLSFLVPQNLNHKRRALSYAPDIDISIKQDE